MIVDRGALKERLGFAEVGLGVLGVELDCAVTVFNRLCKVLHHAERLGTIAVINGDSGVQLDGSVVKFNCLLEVAFQLFFIALVL